MNRSDGALPTVVAIATAPIVLADGGLLAAEGLDRLRGIQFIIQDELRAILRDPKGNAISWLAGVATLGILVLMIWKPGS